MLFVFLKKSTKYFEMFAANRYKHSSASLLASSSNAHCSMLELRIESSVNRFD